DATLFPYTPLFRSRPLRVAVTDADRLGSHAEGVRRDLGPRHLVALAVSARARDDGDDAGPLDPHRAGLPAGRRRLDVRGEAHADDVASRAGSRLLGALAIVLRQGDGPLERGRVIAGVVDLSR